MVEFTIPKKAKPTKAAGRDKARPTLYEALSIQRIEDPSGTPRTCMVATDSWIAVAIPLGGTLLPKPTGRRRNAPLTVSREGVEALEKLKASVSDKTFRVDLETGDLEVNGITYPSRDVGAYPNMVPLFADHPAFYIKDRSAVESGFNGGAPQIAWNPTLAKRLADAMGAGATGADAAIRLTITDPRKAIVAEQMAGEAFGLLMPIRLP